MPQGLQVFDANGRLILNVTDRIGRVITTVRTTPNVAGSYSFPVSTGVNERPFFCLLTTPAYPYQSPQVSRIPSFSISADGKVLSWTAQPMAASAIVGFY